MTTYNKFIVALTAALAVLGSALADGTITAPEWVAVASSFVGALGVYAVTNKPAGGPP